MNGTTLEPKEPVTFTIEGTRTRRYTGTDKSITALVDVDLITAEGFHFAHTVNIYPGVNDTDRKLRNYLRENWEGILSQHPDHGAIHENEEVNEEISVDDVENPLHDEKWFQELFNVLSEFDFDNLKSIAVKLDIDLDYDAISPEFQETLVETIAEAIGEGGDIPDLDPEPEPEEPAPFVPEGPLEHMFLDAWRDLPGSYENPAYLVLRAMNLKQKGTEALTKLADSHNIPCYDDMNDFILAYEIAKRQGEATKEEIKAVKKYNK